MPVYISILRGINVSGHKLIKMTELKALYESLGYTSVKTYIQSGNVVFQSQATASDLAEQIQQGIAGQWGYEVPVQVLEASELDRIIADNPFIAEGETDIKILHATFLAVQPETDEPEAVITVDAGDDEWRLQDRVVYLRCPNGCARTKLTNNMFEQKLKVQATTRNWKTTLKLQQMADEIQSV